MFPNQVPENSNLIESQKDFNEDGWNQEECSLYCKYQKYCSFLSALISLPLIILPFLFYETYPLESAILFGILGILSFIFSFLSYVWSVFFFRNANRVDLSRFGSGLFAFSTFILIFYVLLFIISSVNIAVFRNQIIAEKSLSLTNFNTDLIIFSWILLGLFIVLALFLSYIAFSLYICSVNGTFNRVLLNVYLLCFLFFSLALIYLSTQIADILETRTIIKYIEPWYSSASFAMGIIGAILSFISIFVNLRQWRIGYLVFGSTLLIFIVISLIFTGLIHRKADEIQSGYEKNCIENMKATNSLDLVAEGCPSKYLMKTVSNILVYDLQCDTSNRGLVWEDEQSSSVSDKVNAQACLNIDCCNILGNVYSLWFYALAYCFLTMNIFAFCCVCCLYYLSLKVSLGRNTLIKVDYFFWIVMILMVLTLALLTQLYQAETLNEEEYLVTSTPSSKYDLPFQQNFYAKVYNNNGQICEYLYNYINNQTEYDEMIDQKESCEGPNCLNSVVLRLALLGNGNFSLTNSYNNSYQLKFYDNSYKSEFFPNSSNSDDFILFEGYSMNIDNFLKKELQFCIDDYLILPEFSYVKYSYLLQNTTINSISTTQRTLETTSKSSKTSKKTQNHKETLSYFQISDNAESILNTYFFGNIKIHVYSSETTEPIANVQLSLTKVDPLKNTTCQSNSVEPFRKGVTDTNGVYSFYNLVVRNYHLSAFAENYKLNCKTVLNISIYDNVNVYLVLVPEFNEIAIKVLLFWNRGMVSLSLQSTFNYNENQMCLSSYYKSSCGDMQALSKKTVGDLDFQEIDINYIGNYTYLLYVQKLQSDSEALNLYELEQMGNMNNTENLTINNQDFSDSEPFIQVYVKEMQYPLENFVAPVLGESDLKEADLIWLAFCFNGSIGEVSQREIQQYWSKVEANASFYNRLVGYRNMVPDAGICKNLY